MVNLVELQEGEAHRRLKLLGTAIGGAGGAELRTRARQVSLPVAVLHQWYASYLHGGFPALLPQWELPSEATWALIQQRYTALGNLAEAETLSQEALCTLAANQGWTMRQTLRWLRRYRVGGMMGLAPVKRLVQPRAIPDLGVLSETQRNELFRRYTLLGELAAQEHVSNTLLQKRAEAAGVSLRTLREKPRHASFTNLGNKGDGKTLLDFGKIWL